MPHEKYACVLSNTRMTLKGMIHSHCEWQRGTEADRSQITKLVFPCHNHSGIFFRRMANEVTALQWDFLFSLRTNDSFIFCQFTKVNSIMLNSGEIYLYLGKMKGTRLEARRPGRDIVKAVAMGKREISTICRK